MVGLRRHRRWKLRSRWRGTSSQPSGFSYQLSVKSEAAFGRPFQSPRWAAAVRRRTAAVVASLLARIPALALPAHAPTNCPASSRRSFLDSLPEGNSIAGGRSGGPTKCQTISAGACAVSVRVPGWISMGVFSEASSSPAKRLRISFMIPTIHSAAPMTIETKAKGASPSSIAG